MASIAENLLKIAQGNGAYTPTTSTTAMDGGAIATGAARTEESYSRYAQWEEHLHAMGLRTTTNVRNNGKYFDFADYYAALDADYQKELMSYFEEGAEHREEALEAQQAAAGIFLKYGTSDIPIDVFVKEMRALGYDVEWGSVETGYIVDNKKSAAHQGGEYVRGNITELTIKNKNGDTLFKIVDSNGNASIEIEELFGNELLSGYINDIDPELLKAAAAAVSGTYTSTGVLDDLLRSAGIEETTSDMLDEMMSDEEKASLPDRQKAFNDYYESFLYQGVSYEDAIENAKEVLKSNYGENAMVGVNVPKLKYSPDDKEVKPSGEKTVITKDQRDVIAAELYKQFAGQIHENGEVKEGSLTNSESRDALLTDLDYSSYTNGDTDVSNEELSDNFSTWLNEIEEDGKMDDAIWDAVNQYIFENYEVV